MAFTDPSDLTKAESEELRSHFPAYEQTPTGDKEAFRLDRARHILTARNLSEENSYAFAGIYKKVTYIFHNRAQDEKQPRLPYKIARAYTAQRVFGYTNRDNIRAEVKETYGNLDEESDWYIRRWNQVLRRLYEELSDEEKLGFEAKAAEWNVKGPDNHLKPLIADKRAGAWMRAVCAMFWEQCRMYIFMYGMHETPDGDVRAIPYDTSDMLHGHDAKVPRFRDVPQWDVNFRDRLWDFFPVLINPETARPEAIELVERVKEKKSRPTISFERYDDGTPILFNRDDQGHDLKPQMRRWVLKEYLSIHHQWAAGSESFKAPPWDAFHDHPAKFFAPGMLPDGILLGDLEHMQNDSLKAIFDHIVRMEHPQDDTPPRLFRLSSYRTGRGKNANYIPAKYIAPVPAVTKKARSNSTAPIIYGPRDEDQRPAPVPTKKSKAAKQTVRPADMSSAPLLTAATAGAAPDKGKGVDRGAQSNVGASGVPPPTQAAADSLNAANSARWDALEKEVGENDNDDDGLESSLTELESTAATDDEELADSIPGEHGRPSHRPQPDVDLGVLFLPPKSVGNSGGRRYEFLKELSEHNEYIEMLQRVRPSLEEQARLTGRAPVKWATWSRDSPHLPASLHTDPTCLAEVMSWLRAGVNRGEGPAAIQRYCLVIGMVIRDVTEVQMMEPGEPAPAHLPGYLAQSCISFEGLSELLTLCTNAFPPPPAPRPVACSAAGSSRTQEKGNRRGNGGTASSTRANEAHTTAVRSPTVLNLQPVVSAEPVLLSPQDTRPSTSRVQMTSENGTDDEEDCQLVGTLLGVESGPTTSESGRKRARSDTRNPPAEAAAAGSGRTTRSRTKAASVNVPTVPDTPKSPSSIRADASRPVKRGRRGGRR